MTQRSLFADDTPAHCQPIHLQPHKLARRDSPATSHAAAREIVESGAGENQCQAILELLRLRPATAKELVILASNFRARVSDLRKAGYEIVCRFTRDADTGKKTNIYILMEGE